MNLLEIRTETRRRLAEQSTTKSQYSEADLNKHINEGIKSICTLGRVYEKSTSLTVSATVATYVLPIDFLDVATLRNPAGVVLDPIDKGDAGKVYVKAGYPLNYYLIQSTLSKTTRANITAYLLGAILVPATADGFMYEVTTAGTTAASPPTFVTNPGSPTTDGSATLTCRELATNIYSLTLVDTPTTAGGGAGTYPLTYVAMDEGLYIDTDVPNFPTDRHPILVTFAVMRALQQGRQLVDAERFMKEYATSLGIKQEEVPQ